jgi:hypothetical protein
MTQGKSPEAMPALMATAKYVIKCMYARAPEIEYNFKWERMWSGDQSDG